jgi:hypothetical protein
MRIGRAAADWDRLGCSDDAWSRAVAALRERAASSGAAIALSIYPWDIVTEMETRLESPQAMLLVVPNGKVKLLNALPFSPADFARRFDRGCLGYLPRGMAGGGGAFVHPTLPQRACASSACERDVEHAQECARRVTCAGAGFSSPRTTVFAKSSNFLCVRKQDG